LAGCRRANGAFLFAVRASMLFEVAAHKQMNVKKCLLPGKTSCNAR
jgi:hypothetical protein